jgi:hypothetical protein
MSARPKRKTKSLTTKAVELAVATPQVVAHRVTRMAVAGATLSERDRKEFNLMVAEKKTAFAEAWQAMATQTVRANQTLAASFLRSMWSPRGWGKESVGKMTAQVQGGGQCTAPGAYQVALSVRLDVARRLRHRLQMPPNGQRSSHEDATDSRNST